MVNFPQLEKFFTYSVMFPVQTIKNGQLLYKRDVCDYMCLYVRAVCIKRRGGGVVSLELSV